MFKWILAPPNERGQGLVEYAFILILVAAVVVFALTLFGTSVRDIYCDITRELDPHFHIGIPGICEPEEEPEEEGALPIVVAWQSALE